MRGWEKGYGYILYGTESGELFVVPSEYYLLMKGKKDGNHCSLLGRRYEKHGKERGLM
jgi:hypothetical protein